MEQYIPKSALVAEIEKLRDELQEKVETSDFIAGEVFIMNYFISLLDTLEVKEVPIWEKVSPDTGQTTLYKDEDKSYLERFGYRIDLNELDKLPKKNLKAQEGE